MAMANPLLPDFNFLLLTSFCVILRFMEDPLKDLRAKKALKKTLVIASNTLDKFVAARADIDKQRAEIDKNIIHWKMLVDSLRPFCSDDDEEDPSDVEVSAFVEGGKQKIKFTDGVRIVLKQHRDAPITVPDIRMGLLNLGFDFSKYRQPLTPIHNCLKRLEEQGEVKPEKTNDGQIVGYKWVSSIERALAEEPGFLSWRETLLHMAAKSTDNAMAQRALGTTEAAIKLQQITKPKKD